MPGPSSKKEANANALAAFHHVVAKGQIERVKDFVLVRAPAPLGCAGVQEHDRTGRQCACTLGHRHVVGCNSQHVQTCAGPQHTAQHVRGGRVRLVRRASEERCRPA